MEHRKKADRRQSLRWSRRGAVMVALALLSGLAPVPASATGGGAGVGVVDRTSGIWYLQDPASGATTSFFYGNPGDRPFTGDWDCDGVDSPGLYRQADSYIYLRNSNTQGIADSSFYFGNPGDVPVPGDFDGDGCDTVSIYRPLEATFYVINQLGSGDGGLGAAEFSFAFGNVGDQPLAGDFAGNGVDTFGVFQPNAALVHIKTSHHVASAVTTVPFGESADLVVAGAWSGDIDLLGVYRPSLRGFLLADGSQRTYGNESLYPIVGQFGALPGGAAAPPTQPSYPNVGSGKRIIYANADQRVWLIEEDGTLTDTYLVSGRANTPQPGTYSVFSKSLKANAGHDGITMDNMVRFAHGIRLPYGFHAIPLYADGQPMQTVDELGYFRSGGCVRQTNEHAAFLYEWAPIGTTVHVLP